jgi:hypothetical protein
MSEMCLTILRTCDHPFSFTVKCDSGDVSSVAFEGEDGGWICGFDVVKLDGVMACGCKKALIG